MGILSGSDKKTAASAPAGLSIIGLGMVVRGDIETAGIVKVEGTVNGHVTAGEQVLVAKGGQIDGGIDTGEAVLGGVVHGAVTATSRVEIQSGAVVHGDVTTRRISVADGAVLDGAIRMTDIDETLRAGAARPFAQPGSQPSGPIQEPSGEARTLSSR